MSIAPDDDDRSLFAALLGDGRPLLLLTGVVLILSGAFALFLSITRHFLPHDVQFLGMQPQDLCRINQCRIVHFMFHDRVSFGGVLIAIGSIYLWLIEFPLQAGRAWAWWLLVLSALVGFGSFLAYLGYGYLDTWHGVATLALLPCYVVGLWRSYVKILEQPKGIATLLRRAVPIEWTTAAGLGRICLFATAIGLVGAGATIMTVGMTSVFVPTDLAFMGLSADELRQINPHLVPLIAHDRAGFGGGVCCVGVLIFFCTWCARPSRSLWQVLFVAGVVGFSCAILVHPAIGYTNFIHLLPAYLGALTMTVALLLSFPSMQLQPHLLNQLGP